MGKLAGHHTAKEGPPDSDDQGERYIGSDETVSRTHKRALLKLDLVLLSTVTVIYFLNFLDR
jgi:hypothetical protein